MNEMLHRDQFLPQMPTTQAAEGLPRFRWTVAQIEELTRLGVFHEHENFELIGGEIVPMQAKGARHERAKLELNDYLVKSLPRDFRVIPETTFHLSEDTYVEPDFTLFPRFVGIEGLNGPTALLAIELSDSSLAFDQGRKIAIYASFGVREVWVVNVKSMTTRVHRGLGASGYAEISDHPHTETLVPKFVPGLTVSLASLGLEPSA